jgi:hypothetical protein
MNLIYSCRGGACAGPSPGRIGIKATWPFSRISILANGDIEISLTIRRYIFRKSNIIELIEAPHLFSGGIRFIHTERDIHPYVRFWCFGYPLLSRSLNDAGYTISPWRKAVLEEYKYND